MPPVTKPNEECNFTFGGSVLQLIVSVFSGPFLLIWINKPWMYE